MVENNECQFAGQQLLDELQESIKSLEDTSFIFFTGIQTAGFKNGML